MSLFDIVGAKGGMGVLNTASLNPALNTTGPLPWGSGFEGMNAMSEAERRKRLMQLMQQQQMMAMRNVPQGFKQK